jgi:hypothetical protein
MSYTSRSNLEASPLELVLRIYLTKVLPLGSFTITSGSRLLCQLLSSVQYGLTG